MGGLRKLQPITFVVFLVGALALSGCPPFSGFFSKMRFYFRSIMYRLGHFGH